MSKLSTASKSLLGAGYYEVFATDGRVLHLSWDELHGDKGFLKSDSGARYRWIATPLKSNPLRPMGKVRTLVWNGHTIQYQWDPVSQKWAAWSPGYPDVLFVSRSKDGAIGKWKRAHGEFGLNENPLNHGDDLLPDDLRSVIGTLAHNRSFTITEVEQYTRLERPNVAAHARDLVQKMVRLGYLDRVGRGQYFPTGAGWDWIESRSNPLSPPAQTALIVVGGLVGLSVLGFIMFAVTANKMISTAQQLSNQSNAPPQERYRIVKTGVGTPPPTPAGMTLTSALQAEFQGTPLGGFTVQSATFSNGTLTCDLVGAPGQLGAIQSFLQGEPRTTVTDVGLA